MAKELSKKVISVFEQIKLTGENGNEFWMARQLAKALEYADFRNFSSVIEKAKEACKNSGQRVENHLVEVNEMVAIGSGAEREMQSYKLRMIKDNPDIEFHFTSEFKLGGVGEFARGIFFWREKGDFVIFGLGKGNFDIIKNCFSKE